MGIKINQLETLQALINQGIEQAAIVLNEIFDAQICLQVSPVEILSLQQASQILQVQSGLAQVSAMRLPFVGTSAGNALLVFSIDSAAQLVAVLMHETTDLPDLNAIKRGLLSEISNIILNRVMAGVSQELKQSLRYAIPLYFEGTVSQLLSEAASEITSEAIPETAPEAEARVLLTHTCLTCNLLQLTGDVVLVFTVQSFATLHSPSCC